MTNIEAFVEQLEGRSDERSPYFVGIDAGSSATKCVVIINESGTLVGHRVVPSGFSYEGPRRRPCPVRSMKPASTQAWQIKRSACSDGLRAASG